MKIKSLYIKEYKNIKEQTFDFESHNGITLIIGNNGSGKSNLLECISDIFYNLYTSSTSFKTNFTLEYHDDNNRLYKVEWNGENISKSIDDNSETSTNSFKLPSRVVAIYSGEEERLWTMYYYEFYKDFIKRLNNSTNATNIISSPEFPKMLYLNRYYWNIALLSLACIDNNNKFIEESLGIRSIESITFKYGEKDVYDNYAISDILTLVKNIDDEIEYTIDTFKNKIESKDEYYDYGNLFMHLYLASTAKGNKLIENIKITFNQGQTLADLSEGAKKRLLIKAALEFGGQEDSLFLLDEPDAHVHISNKKEIYDILAEYSSNRHIILTSHSPTMCKHIENKDSIIMLEDGTPKPVGNQYEAAKNLIGDNTALDLLFSTKHIVLVEGKTDCIYINKAIELYKKDYPELSNNLDFIAIGGTDGEVAKDFIDKINITDDCKVILLVDRDDAGLKCAKKILNDDSLKKEDLDIEEISKRQYLIMLPHPSNTKTDTLIEDYFGIQKIKEIISNKINATTHFNGLPDKGRKYVKGELEEFAKTDLQQEDMKGFKVLLNKLKEAINK